MTTNIDLSAYEQSSTNTAHVEMTLLYHRSTSALNTKVEKKRGVVTLYGKAGKGAGKTERGNIL